MATNFNGTDIFWLPSGGSATALNVIRCEFSLGEVPRVDATHAGSSARTYLGGIPEANTVSIDSYNSPGDPGQTGTFSGNGNMGMPGADLYRIESASESGNLDEAVTYTTTFVRIS